MIELDALLGSLSTLTAVPLAWWLANKSRDRADAKAEQAALEAQCDALLQAVVELQTAAATNRILWEGLLERWRSGLLVSMASLDGYAERARPTDPSGCGGTASLGATAEMLSRERRDAKLAAASLKEPLIRIAAAAAPLMRPPDPAVSAATNRLVAATTDVPGRGRLDAALREFGEAVRAALRPSTASAPTAPSPPPADPLGALGATGP